MANCPRCRQLLVANQVDEFSVRLCVPCKGILMPHADVVTILDRSWHAVTPENAEKMEFFAPTALKDQPKIPCPDCRQLMDQYGYMGLAAIPLNRCDKCSLLWLEADELQNMVLALAKTNYRTEKARLAEWHADTTEFVSVGMKQMRSISWPFGNRREGVGVVVAEALLDLLR